MRARFSPAELLLRIVTLTDEREQLANFRQALLALSQSVGALAPPPLDGVSARALEATLHFSLERGLADDTSFMAPGEIAVSLYELSTALPSGSVKREVRRKVFKLLYEGNAATFVAVATRMALGSAEPLLAPTLRARIALCADMPVGASINIAPLALALVTRTSTRQAWLNEPSTGGLSSRRLAAQLLEHAAREAVFRMQLGDPQPRNLLVEQGPANAFGLLLNDREPLVWRHAAVARGLLASISPQVRERIEGKMDPSLSITDWRRAAVGLVASTVSGDEEARRSVLAIIEGQFVQRDPGLPAAMVMGLPRVIESDPDLALELLDRLAEFEHPQIAQNIAALSEEVRDPHFAQKIRESLRKRLVSAGKNLSPVERALSSFDIAQLSSVNDPAGLSSMLKSALLAFEEEGAKQAYDKAQGAVEEAHEVAHFIEATATDDAGAMGTALSALSELDGCAFERARLNHLLLLAQRPGDKAEFVEPMARLENRTSQWILRGVESSGEAAWQNSSAIVDQLRLKVLLHLVDVESQTASETPQVLRRVIQASRVLLKRLALGPDAQVHRVLCATLARSFDAAVREGALQASDLVLATSSSVSDSFSIATIAEGSTLPDVATPLRALAAFMDPGLFDVVQETSEEFSSLSVSAENLKDEHAAESLRLIERLMSLSQGIVGGGGYHPESLRRVFFRIARASELIAVASGIQELVVSRDAMSPVLEEFQSATSDLADMMRSARQRVLGDNVEGEDDLNDPIDLFSLCERAVTTDIQPEKEVLAQRVEALIEPLPDSIQRALAHILFVLRELPLSSRPTSLTMPLVNRKAPLPNWLLPRRTIGSFHVVRPLGAGGVSSVFYARRIEERNRPGAEAFALKVPEYDPATARSMSEDAFYAMFRDEAGALLSLPEHENLARFVTFDLSARPKPILVMELITGTSLDKITRTRALDMQKVVSYLDGVLAGLEAMHAVGVGHLDVKASNIILRSGRIPVLVDFGLSGRKVRPGCGTLEYTAPEVLGIVPEGATADATKADIYALGCLAFELITGKLLFDGPDEMAVVSKHVAHDGWVEGLQDLAKQEESVPISSLLASCIRHDGRNRPTAAYLREQLPRALYPLLKCSWPYNPLSPSSIKHA